MSLMLHRAALLRPTLGGAAPSLPDAFETADWSVAPGDEEADVTIDILPANGGASITDIEYRLDGGSWVSSGGTSSFTISELTNEQEYDVELRAVNSVGAGAASDTKQVTPESGAEEFNPATWAVWLDASDGDTLKQERTGASATTPSGTDGVVGSWFNKGTLGGWITTDADGKRPILRAGGRIELDGGDDVLALLGAFDPLGGPCTIVLGIRGQSFSSWPVIFGSHASSGQNSGIGTNGSGQLGLHRAGGAFNASSHTLSTDTNYVVAFTSADGLPGGSGTLAGVLRLNGTPSSDISVTGYGFTPDGLTIGNNGLGGGGGFDGFIYQILSRNGTAGSEELAAAEAFVASKMA